MWWTRAERRRRRGNALVRMAPMTSNDQDGVDGAAVDGERAEQCADGAAASRTPAPGFTGTGFTGTEASRRLGHAGERGRDGGRILL
jgi:hypothetical protein